jgi:hypothetical protein
MNPSEIDTMFEMMFARISVIETALMLLWNDHPYREKVRASAANILGIREANELYGSASDLAITTRELASQGAFAAIFHELLSEKDCDSLRNLSKPSPSSPLAPLEAS